jgi:hypothetical protein
MQIKESKDETETNFEADFGCNISHVVSNNEHIRKTIYIINLENKPITEEINAIMNANGSILPSREQVLNNTIKEEIYKNVLTIEEIGAIINIDDFILPSREQLIDAQNKDEKARSLIHIIQTKGYTKIQKGKHKLPFFLDNGLLMRITDIPHLFKKRKASYAQVEQIYIPEPKNNWIKRTFLYMVHGLPLSGHDGVKITIAKAEARYYWPKMKTDIRKWCLSCLG